MNRNELLELHYITPISNLPSILANGVLSHTEAAKLDHASIAKQEVQDIRARKVVPGGMKLHDYANLYICARNPMLYKRLGQRRTIVVLRIDQAVLDIAGAVVTDMNAASENYVRFAAAPGGLVMVDREMVFAEDWRHPGDSGAYYRHKAVKCAELLVPTRVTPNFILGGYVCGDVARAAVDGLGLGLPLAIDAHFFFDQN